jgi:hypothetical protein
MSQKTAGQILLPVVEKRQELRDLVEDSQIENFYDSEAVCC